MKTRAGPEDYSKEDARVDDYRLRNIAHLHQGIQLIKAARKACLFAALLNVFLSQRTRDTWLQFISSSTRTGKLCHLPQGEGTILEGKTPWLVERGQAVIWIFFLTFSLGENIWERWLHVVNHTDRDTDLLTTSLVDNTENRDWLRTQKLNRSTSKPESEVLLFMVCKSS